MLKIYHAYATPERMATQIIGASVSVSTLDLRAQMALSSTDKAYCSRISSNVLEIRLVAGLINHQVSTADRRFSKTQSHRRSRATLDSLSNVCRCYQKLPRKVTSMPLQHEPCKNEKLDCFFTDYL